MALLAQSFAKPEPGRLQSARPSRLQAKLRVGPIDDPREREADRVADAVISGGPAGSIAGAAAGSPQRKCAECEAEEDKAVRRKAAGGNPAAPVHTTAVTHAGAAVLGGGMPLTTEQRTCFEPRFGRDLSNVRLYTGDEAAAAANQIHARAFTLRNDIAFARGEFQPGSKAGRHLIAHELAHTLQQDRGMVRRQTAPTGINLKDAKPFGHADLTSDELKTKWRTYIGSATLLQVTPTGNYKGHCVKEHLTEVANTCPPRFAELRTEGFCTGDKCLDFDRWGTAGDAGTGKTVTDGPDTFMDLHRTRHPQSLLEGTGKDTCSVVCHQRYKYDRTNDLGSFYIVRNFKAGRYTPPGSKDSLHVTTGEVQKASAVLEAPSAEKFAKDIAPGLKTSGILADAPAVPKTKATSEKDRADK